MIEHYEIYYLNILIGYLDVDCKLNKYLYTPNNEEINKIKGSVFEFLTKESKDYVDPIPFFENRIINMKKFKLTELQYSNDFYKIKKIFSF